MAANLTPDSWGSTTLVEVNHCHGKGKGHPCTGPQADRAPSYRVEEAPDSVFYVNLPDDAGQITLRTGRAKGAELQTLIPKGYAAIEWAEVKEEGSGHGLALYRAALHAVKQRGLRGLASLRSDRNYESAQFWRKLQARGATTSSVIVDGETYDLLTEIP